MKIRTDFVTNSSSSSFCVEIAFNLKNGSTVSFNAEGATGETGPINYFNGDAIVKASPKYLGTSKDINELIQRLTDGVFDLAWNSDIDDEVEIKIFEKSYPVESEWGETYDAYEFIEEIRDNINSPKDIKSIVISGTEEGVQGQKHKQVYKYNLDTKKYTGIVYGAEFESEGGAGELKLSDLNACNIEYKDADEEFFNIDDENEQVIESIKDTNEDNKEKYISLFDKGLTKIESCLTISYENDIIKQLLKQYNYKCSVCDADSIDCYIDQGEKSLDYFSDNMCQEFPYYGVKTLENLSKTIISFLINNGSFDDGFINAIMERFDSIINSYQMIDGNVVSCIDWDEHIYKGYIFEMKNGKYICKAEECWGGW